MNPHAKSANEIEGLVLKAARGGGLPLGHAEDLSAAASYLDLDALTRCPCDSGAALAIPLVFDAVLAGKGPQSVVADSATVLAYVKATEAATGRAVLWTGADEGVMIEGFGDLCPPPDDLGRRVVPAELLRHLNDLAAKTLVPETDASRQSGAGAGLTDND